MKVAAHHGRSRDPHFVDAAACPSLRGLQVPDRAHQVSQGGVVISHVGRIAR